MYLCLTLDGQSEEALANSTQVNRDWEEGRVQGSSVTSCFSPEAGGCMGTYSLAALFQDGTPHKLLHSLQDRVE